MHLKIAFAALVTTLVSCVTYTGQSPRINGFVPTAVSGVGLINGNTEKQERIFFSDGIATLTAQYSKWTNYLITQFAIGQEVTEDQKKKSLEVTIQSIACSGSFLTNCYVSASILTGKGEKVIFNTENVYGYGAVPTASKALDQIADMMRASPQVNRYIHNQ